MKFCNYRRIFDIYSQGLLNNVFGVVLKIDTRSQGLDKQNEINRYSQRKERRERLPGTTHSTKALFL